jgi:hypothetical protein
MRLRGAALAAVLTGSVLAGGAGTLGALGLAAAPAGAAGNPAITIRAIDREGKVVAVTASLQSPVISPTGIDETLTSAHSTQVPPGTYNIAAWVYEPDGSAQTLADRELTVKTSGTVTFDARQGHRILFTVNDPTVALDGVFAEPYSPRGWDAFDGYGSPSGDAVYAVPGTMAPGYYLALQADLVRPGDTLSPVEYVLVRQLKGKIPADLTFAVNKAGLANDHVTVKAIDPGTAGGVNFQPIVDENPGDLPATPAGQSAIAPFSIEFHFTPGYAWEAQSFSGTDNLDSLPVFGVHNYAQTFDNATFGPSPQFGPYVGGNQLFTPAPFGDHLFDDPTQDLNTSFGMQASSGQTWLYEGKKLIAHSVNGTVSAKISTSPHWYTLRVQADRGPGATLWKSETISFNFETQANGNPQTFWPRIIPSGLSLRNAARPGTKTPVRIYLSDLGVNLPGHGVKVWASVNGGQTWQALRVSQSGPHWTAIVTNPGQPGFVSLRVQGTDPAGDTATVTTVNAYAVS